MCTLLVNGANKIQMCNKVSFKIQGSADIQKGWKYKIRLNAMKYLVKY